MTIRQLAYTSIAREGFTSADLTDILETARRSNAIHGITGLLLCSENVFMQVIEGAPHDIEQLLANISQDQRHTMVRCIYDGAVSARTYHGWDMKFFTFESRRDVRLNEILTHLQRRITEKEMNLVHQLVESFQKRIYASA